MKYTPPVRAGLKLAFGIGTTAEAMVITGLTQFAFTINEPNAQVSSYVIAGMKPFAREAEVRAAAAKAIGADQFCGFFQGNSLVVRDITIAAHAKGREAIKSVAPHMKVGITLALQQLDPGPGGEVLYHRLYDEARRPYYDACAHDDFIGVQVYTHLVTGPNGYTTPPLETGAAAWQRDAPPSVLAAVVQEVHGATGAPVLVTENGIDTTDEGVRSAYLTATVDGLLKERAAGVPVLGCSHWTLIDNWEWSSGYVPRLGLVAVDRTTFKRTPKTTCETYRRLVAARRNI